MAYEKTNWINNVTPLNATNMNHIETGIEANSTNIGDLSNLSTTAKNNTVAAINEVKTGSDSNKTNIGTLSNLTTTSKTDLVNAINEVNSNTDPDSTDVCYTDAEIDALLDIE